MNIELGLKLIGAIVSAVVFIVIIKVTVDNLKETVNSLKEEDKQQWAIITKVREWQTEHEKEAAQRRLEIEREMGKLRESAGKVESQLSELVILVRNLDARLEKWIDKQG